MAREAYRSIYGDLTKLKDSSLLGTRISGTGDDDALFQLLLAVSEWADHYCNRIFYPLTATRYFDGDGSAILVVPDLLAVTSLKEDTNGDKTFDTTWATTDYWTIPYHADPTSHWGSAYDSLLIREQGDKASFASGERNFELIGKWGFRELKEDSGTDLNDASFTGGKTTMAVDDGTKFQVGMTIMLDDEQFLITAISTNDLTVTPALNGTTAAAHDDNKDIYIVRFPLGVARAVLIQVARLWVRAPEFEPYYVGPRLDTDVRDLLTPYRRLIA